MLPLRIRLLIGIIVGVLLALWGVDILMSGETRVPVHRRSAPATGVAAYAMASSLMLLGLGVVLASLLLLVGKAQRKRKGQYRDICLYGAVALYFVAVIAHIAG